MNINERKLKGVFEITLNPHEDERGFFMRTFDQSFFNESGINRNWVQENHSCSLRKNIIRGLHFQFPPFAETKLVRCIRGKVLDVFVDIRKGSDSFGQWDSIELSEDNYKMIMIPRGFAHGFCTLTERSEVLYKVDNFYNKESESGIIWNDNDLNIKWNVEDPILSEKDAAAMTFEEFCHKHKSIEL